MIEVDSREKLLGFWGGPTDAGYTPLLDPWCRRHTMAATITTAARAPAPSTATSMTVRSSNVKPGRIEGAEEAVAGRWGLTLQNRPLADHLPAFVLEGLPAICGALVPSSVLLEERQLP